MSLAKSNRPSFVLLDELVNRIRPGTRLSIGGHHFARLPIAALTRIVDHGIGDLNYFAWAGGLPLELLLEAGAVSSIDICFSSLDIFGLAPHFRDVAENRRLPVTDWPALAMIQALRAAQQNLPFMPVQLPEGSTMVERCPAISYHRDSRTGRMIGLVEAQVIDTVLLHAPRADENGNVQIYGARALDLAIIGAAREVLVTVDEVVPVGALRQIGRQTVITRNLISAIAGVTGGAYPTSSLPYYATDFARIRDVLAGKHGSLRAGLEKPGDAPPDLLVRAAAIRPEEITPVPFRCDAAPPAAPTIDEIMVVRIARMLDNECFASAGAVSPLGNVAFRLAKATHAPNLFIGTFSCGHVDIEAGTMTLSLLEAMDAGTAVSHNGGDDTYSTYYQAGIVTHEIIAAAQVDACGRTNNIELNKPSGGLLRLPGQGGMSDAANMHRDYVVYVPRHTRMSLVERVEAVSSARGVLHPADREAAGYRPGNVYLVTNLCLFRYDENAKQFIVIETMPGVNSEVIVAETGFKVIFAEDCKEMVAPTSEELRVLREEVDPLGIRRLEFVAARERGDLLDDILMRDRKGTAAIVDRQGGTRAERIEKD